ncbi:LysR family transcriptional regulator [Ochrobactrum teleogrylli]|uniref:LysR family transcriptional regulator n=1 Tax=Ochrobactrum teleogrylli TaxID=2479765 RepID=A0ABD5K529_9HYPH
MMRLTFSQLETFYWVSQLGSVHKAANHLNIAQPTASLRLKELRDALQTDLFERNGSGLVVTPDGKALLPHISTIMNEIAEIRQKNTALPLVGPVRVGLAEGFAVNCLPPLLDTLQQEHPQLTPEWSISISTGLEAAILEDRLDLAVILNPTGHEKMTLQPLGVQPTTWVIPSAWHISQPVTPKDLWLRPVVTNPAPSAMYRQVTGWFAAEALFPSQVSICTSVAVIAELVAGGLGAAILPVRMAERYVKDGGMRMVATHPPVENGRLFIASRTGVEDTKVIAVSRIIRKIIQDLDYVGIGTRTHV